MGLLAAKAAQPQDRLRAAGTTWRFQAEWCPCFLGVRPTLASQGAVAAHMQLRRMCNAAESNRSQARFLGSPFGIVTIYDLEGPDTVT